MKLKRLLNQFSIAVCFLYLILFFAQSQKNIAAQLSTSKITTLEQTRNKITIPQYTPEQKKQIATQAQLMLNHFYVNSETKSKRYGNGTDINPKLSQIVDNAENLADAELQFGLADIFLSQRDLHTNFYLPAPHACYTAFLPFSVKQFTKPDGSTSFAIDSNYSDQINLLAPEIKEKFQTVQIGDELLQWNQQPLWKILESTEIFGLRHLGAGTATGPALSRALQHLTYASGAMGPMPTKDNVQLKLLSAEGKIKEFNLPWLVKTKNSCLESPNQIFQAAAQKHQMSLTAMAQEKDQLGLQLIQERNNIIGIPLIPTADRILSSARIKTDRGEFAYIRLSSFVPDVTSPLDFPKAFAQLLTQYSDTQGLILDVRDNGGGYGLIADAIPQLVSPQTIQTTLKRIRDSEWNRKYVDTDNGAALFRKAFSNSKEFYSKAIKADEVDPNGLGQFYFAPVAYLMNGNCFSACDYLGVNLQDNSIGTIWGENSWQSGGGGANVWDHGFFLKQMLPATNNPFQALSNNQNMRIAWGQAMRVGRNTGKLIEDNGTTADRVIFRSKKDVIENDADLIQKITNKLAFDSKNSNNSALFINEELNSTDVNLNDTIEIPANIANIHSVSIVANGIQLPAIDTSNIRGSVKLIAPPEATQKTGFVTLEIKGYYKNQLRARVIRKVRVLPAPLAFPENQNLENNFTDNTYPFSIFTESQDKDFGWQLKDGALATQKSDLYANSSNTTALLLLDTTGRKTLELNFDLKTNTEHGYDFFWVEAKNSLGAKIKFDKISGTTEGPQKLDLSGLVGGALEIKFVFSADGGSQGKGVTIDNLKIQ